jgi:RND superfamily putative drug exporter
MVGVFAIFATLSSLELKQMGVGLAVAILIDATIIRGPAPATMKLLGDWNWWLPKSLGWLPRISRGTTARPASAKGEAGQRVRRSVSQPAPAG